MENDSTRTPVPLDRYDRRILEELQRDGNIANSALAQKIGLSPSPCMRRVRQLKKAGIIDAVVTLLNPDALGLKLTMLALVSMDRHTPERFGHFEEQVRQHPEVTECLQIADQSLDYLLKIVAPDLEYFQEFLKKNIHRIDGVADVRSSFVSRQVVCTTALPLPPIHDK